MIDVEQAVEAVGRCAQAAGGLAVESDVLKRACAALRAIQPQEPSEEEVGRLTKMLAVFESSAVEAVKDAKRLEKERDEALAWAKNWETACEAKNKQLDEYDEKVAASEMVAIERGGCDAAMREMEIARHESARLAGERDAALARAEKAEAELSRIHASRSLSYSPIFKQNESGHCVRVPPSNEPFGRVFGGFEHIREVEVTGLQVLVSEDGHGGLAIPLLRITSQRVTSWIALDTDGMRYLALCCDNAAAYSEGRTL